MPMLGWLRSLGCATIPGVTPSLPVCASCGSLAAAAIFLPSFAESEYVVPVCGKHDVMGDGEWFTFDTMASSAASFLAAFDRQQVDDQDDALRGWLVERANGVEASSHTLTVAEAAAYLKVNAETIRRRVRRGDLMALPRIGNAPIRIEPDELSAERPARRRVTPKPSDLVGRKPATVAWPQ
jgi:excisionase family DNA binding protein